MCVFFSLRSILNLVTVKGEAESGIIAKTSKKT